jgi:hypothetical protein
MKKGYRRPRQFKSILSLDADVAAGTVVTAPVRGLEILPEFESPERRTCSCTRTQRDTRCAIRTKLACDPRALHVRSCKEWNTKSG